MVIMVTPGEILGGTTIPEQTSHGWGRGSRLTKIEYITRTIPWSGAGNNVLNNSFHPIIQGVRDVSP